MEEMLVSVKSQVWCFYRIY